MPHAFSAGARIDTSFSSRTTCIDECDLMRAACIGTVFRPVFTGTSWKIVSKIALSSVCPAYREGMQ